MDPDDGVPDGNLGVDLGADIDQYDVGAGESSVPPPRRVPDHLHELRYERGALVVHEVRQHVQMQMTVLVVLAPVVMPASGCKCR